jgi:hypothetical protein
MKRSAISPAGARYAFLFKVHFWDDFAARRLREYTSRIRSGDIFVLADETHGPVELPGAELSGADAVIYTEDTAVALRLAAYPKGRLFWWSTDYPLYLFYQKNPDYDYYVMSEYDAGFSGDVDDLIAKLDKDAVDYLAYPIKQAFEDWDWRGTIDGIYGAEIERHHHLECFSVFSRRAVAFLMRRRLQLSKQFNEGAIENWPFAECFVPMELLNGGFKWHPLSHHGDDENFDWWPPYREADWARTVGSAFAHPVLDDRRYLRSLSDKHPHTGDFLADTWLRRRVAALSPLRFVPNLLDVLEARREGSSAIANLREKLRELRAQAEAGALPNIALGCPATQSSVSEWSREADQASDAAGAVSGRISGDYGFHTMYEHAPWWMVDLRRPHLLFRIKIYDRPGFPDRSRALAVFCSADGRDWHPLFSNRDTPERRAGTLILIGLEPPVLARFVRIELGGYGVLHLDEVEIFGCEPSPDWL